jgi:hypothetical protein
LLEVKGSIWSFIGYDRMSDSAVTLFKRHELNNTS